MESNEIEITQNLKTRYYLFFGVLAIIFIILNIIFGSIMINYLSFFLIFEGILLAFIVILGICGFYAYSRNKWVKYSVSKQKFMIIKPKKIRFEINWSEFDVMKFKILGSQFATLKPSVLERDSNIFKIKFIRGNKQVKSIRFGIFRTTKARQLAKAIVNYAQTMGKDIILQRHAKRFYSDL